MIPRPLFGGAIELALPARFVDVSPFRQIPDHQEVFFDGPSDQSVIVEILSFVPQENARAAAYHFECVQAPIDRRLVCRHLPLTPFSRWRRDIAAANDATEQMEVCQLIELTPEDMPRIEYVTSIQSLIRVAY